MVRRTPTAAGDKTDPGTAWSTGCSSEPSARSRWHIAVAVVVAAAAAAGAAAAAAAGYIILAVCVA